MMSTRKKAYYFFFLFGWIIVSSISCNRKSATSEAEESAIVITPVTIVPINYKPVTETIDLPAISTFLNKSILRSSTTGTIESISVNPGNNVKKDQTLFTIRTREASAINNSLKGDSTLVFSGMINIVSSKEGVISSVSHQNGDFVQEGDELAVISEQNSLVFILDIPFEFVKYVEKNNGCKIQLPDNQIINGKITGRLPEMDSQAQTVKYVIIPLFSAHLPANLNAVVSIVKSSKSRAAVLPKSAVLGNETQTEFWVMKLINDSTAIKVIVTKGFENNEEVEITGPQFLLSERIILSGSYGLPDTARVIISK
jgi:multidrug efflux pump subunit AcrA (membrane-fusion protein)